MEYIIIYIATVITTYILDGQRTKKLFKDIADNGYKLNLENYSQLNGSADDTIRHMQILLNFIPFINVCLSLYSYVDYINNKDMQFEALRVSGAIEKMNKQESYIYDARPKSEVAITISVASKEEINSLYKDAREMQEAKEMQKFTKKLKRKEINKEDLVLDVINYYYEKYPDAKEASEHIQNITPEEVMYIYNNYCNKQEDDIEYIYDDEIDEEEKGFSKVKKR